MKKIAHLFVASCFVAALFLPLFTWTFVEAPDASLVYTLKQLTYEHVPGSIVSQMENMALYWLCIGLAVIQISLGFGSFALQVATKLFNASALLSSALIFSIGVTAYRAENTLQMTVSNRMPEAASWLIVVAWIASLWLFIQHHKSVRLGQKPLPE